VPELDEIINKKWYVHPNHHSPGGWNISTNKEDLPSEIPAAVVNMIINKEVAEHIVEIHNSWFAMKFIGEGIKNFFEDVNKSLTSFNDKMKTEGIHKI